MRLFLYAVLPVPIALTALVAISLAWTGSWALAEPVAFGIFVLCCYVAAGGQSVLFAFLLNWWDRRGASRRSRCMASALAGALLGASMNERVVDIAAEFLPGMTMLGFVVLGAGVGPAAAVLVDWLAPTGGRGARGQPSSVAASARAGGL